jgi:hypothetical protein
MSIEPEAHDREERTYRTKPHRAQNAFVTVLFGLVIVLFSAGWTILWFRNVEGLPMFCGLTGLVILGAGLKIVVDAMRGGGGVRAFARNSTSTDATVLNRYTEHQAGADIGDSRETYYIVVRFVAEGQQRTLHAEVDEHMYTACWRGRPLSVRYANTDPSIALLEGEW